MPPQARSARFSLRMPPYNSAACSERLLTMLILVVMWTTVRSTQAQTASVGRREPIKILGHGDELLVINRRSGSVAQLRPFDKEVRFEWPIAQRLADCVSVKQTKTLSWFVAADDSANELILWQFGSDANEKTFLRTAGSLAVPSNPTHLLSLSTSNRLIASISWAHELLECQVNCADDSGELHKVDRLALPFIPGPIIATADEQHLIVADAYGPHLAVVSRQPLRLTSVLRIPGHNVGSIAWTPDGTGLQLAHVMLNDFIPTTRDHVFWGNVVSSMLRVLPREELLRDRPESVSEPFKLHGSLFPLGRESRAAGDPGAMLVTPRQDLLIAIQGTHELAVRLHNERLFTRIAVGKGPSAIWSSPDGNQWFVASRFDDRLIQIDRQSLSEVHAIALSPPAKPSLIERGEQLFYDSTLSLDGWFSCHSCHTNGHTCGLLNDNFGDSRVGAPKQIPTLLGTKPTAPWAWNGTQPDLAQQIRKSLEQTLRSTERKEHPTIPDTTVDALTAYIQTLPSAPSVKEARGQVADSAIARGRELFTARECANCHVPPAYTSPSTYDVGLEDERGTREFNPPSLRGVSQRSRWLHDGRAHSLREVLSIHPHPNGSRCTEAEIDDLVTFLESL